MVGGYNAAVVKTIVDIANTLNETVKNTSLPDGFKLGSAITFPIIANKDIVLASITVYPQVQDSEPHISFQ